MAELHANQPGGKVPSADLTGTTVGRRFAVRARLGEGGMGEVYRADDTKLKRPVALKRVAPPLRSDDRYRQRLVKEAERASSLSYEHIAGVYDVLEENGEVFVVMEYIEGETLHDRMQRPLPLKEFREIAVQCADALVAAHKRGLVHRDIKPKNIMLNTDGKVKILDFGIAKRLPRSQDTKTTGSSDTPGSGVSGTLGYIAPEVLLEEESDGRADIFSLGVVFYQMLTGRHPFPGGSWMAVNDQVLHAMPLRVSLLNPKVSPELERIVMKMLAKRPEERYATAADLRVDLRGQPPPPPPGLLERLAHWWRSRTRRQQWAAGVALAALAVVLFLPSIREAALCAVGRCPVPAQKHVVVLPFRAVGGTEQDKIYCNGFTETITAQLTRLTLRPDLQVAPASDVREKGISTAERARTELGANLVLDASWQRLGEIVRINVVLVDTRTKRQLRTETITTSPDDLFALQDRVVTRAVGMLEVELSPEQSREIAGRGTATPAAYEYYVQGRGYLRGYDKPENIDNAIDLFQDALVADPNYARAYAKLGEAYWKKYEHSKESRWIDKARQACQQASQLENGESAAAHICLGIVYAGTGSYEQAERELKQALEIEPTSDNAYRQLGRVYQRMGNTAAAEKTFKQAIEERSTYWAGYLWLGNLYAGEGRYREAARQFQQAAQLAPDNVHAYRNLGGIYILMGQFEEAIKALEKSIELRPNAGAYSNLGTAYFSLQRYEEALDAFKQAAELGRLELSVIGNLARAYWVVGKQDKAQATYERAIELGEEQLRVGHRGADVHILLADYRAKLGHRVEALRHLESALKLQPEHPEYLYFGAVVHNLLGERETALDYLEQALAQGYSVAEIRTAPELENLRRDQRFQTLMETN